MWIEAQTTMPELAEDMVVRNLVEALNRLDEDLDRVELWTAVLKCFQDRAPEYAPGGDYLLPTRTSASYDQ
jgi:hypothetical protein